MTLWLTDDEAHALAKRLHRALADDPFPFAPRLDPAEWAERYRAENGRRFRG